MTPSKSGRTPGRPQGSGKHGGVAGPNVRFRVSFENAGDIDAAAKRAGLTRSEFSRRATLEAASKFLVVVVPFQKKSLLADELLREMEAEARAGQEGGEVSVRLVKELIAHMTKSTGNIPIGEIWIKPPSPKQ